MAVTIGSLIVKLGLDSTEFLTGSTKAQSVLRDMQIKFANIGKSVADVGKSMSLGVSLPIIGMGAAVVKVAANFESSMNRVQIATEASAAEMKAMGELALKIGNDTTFGASEAAGAMEMLAKAGVDTKVIIGGAAKAVTDLAAATGSQLDPAASAISDSINQFHLAAKDLPTIVNQITGAVNESKFAFDDFTDGMAQGGGVASSAGMSFKDFAATLAATSSQFASGSDAGTSFKTFLLALTPNTKKAANAMKQYGLEFFDAAGKMRPIGEIAEMLRVKFAGLNDETRNAAFKDIFGTDAIRTAVGLMNQGAAGIDNIQQKLANTKASDQAAKLMGGLAGQIEQLKGAFETLAIAIANTGLLSAVTEIVKHFATFVSWLSQAHPAMLKVAVAIAALAAVMGPLLIVMGTLAATVLPLFLVGLGPIGIAVSALVNPLGTLITLFGRLALSLVASSGAIGAAFSGLAAVAAPILLPLAGIAAVAITIYRNWDSIAPVLQAAGKAFMDAVGPALTELINTLSKALNDLFSGPLGSAIQTAIQALGQLNSALLKPFGPAIVETVRLFGQTVANALNFISDAAKLVSGVLNGDFTTALNGLTGVFNRIFGGIPGIIQKMVTAVRNLLLGNLGAVWDTVKKQIQSVKETFHALYDAVVGHSYIPDMVDGIADQMIRLDGVMVKPAKRAADQTKAIFQKLAEDVRAIMDELFPEARAQADFMGKFNKLQAGINAGGAGGFSVDQLKGAQERLLDNGLGPVKDAFASLFESAGVGFAAMTDGVTNVADALGEKMSTALEGVQDRFSGLKDLGREAISSIADHLTNAIMGAESLGDALRGVIAELAKMAINKLLTQFLSTAVGIPGFASGTSFAPGGMALVGEHGPELVNLPRGSQVIPNHEVKGMGGRQEIHKPTFVFPGVTNAKEAREAAGQAARRYRRELNPMRNVA